MEPETRYARMGRDRIAYQTLGEGPVDLVVTPGTFGAMDVEWEDPEFALLNRQLASSCRLIRYDRRGSGASDPVPIDALPPLEASVEELLTVMDAVDSERAVVLAVLDATPVAMLCAATRPGRVSGLILYHAAARHVAADDYPYGMRPEALEPFLERAAEAWGSDELVWLAVPSRAADERFRRWFSKFMRAHASPRAADAYLREMFATDVRSILPSIHVPTLVMHRTGYAAVPIEHGRYVAEHIDGAELVEMPGADGPPAWEGRDQFVAAVVGFLGRVHPGDVPAGTDRAVATVLFTDIESSTERARALGDRAWRDLLDVHDDLARRHVEEARGRLVKTTGDGILATFDGPGRALTCALRLRGDLVRVGLPVRCGLHAGEVELRGDDVGGIAVHIAARVMSVAEAGEILVSRTVADLLVGSGIELQGRGSHELKGVEGRWQLFALVAPAP